tara:strand:- start:1986 stop:2366 length:381 start_codon:yes stop_codon:yes gene_type:complete
MTDKKFIYKTFNDHIKEFMNDIINVFPREVDLLTSRTFLEGIIKVKPRLLLEYWYKSIYLVYKVQIDKGDFDFFVNKKYDETECSDDVLKGIEKMRSKIRLLSDESKKASVQYAKNLSKLAQLYYS